MKLDQIETLSKRKYREYKIISRLESVKKHQKTVSDWLQKHIDTRHPNKPKMWAELHNAEKAERRLTKWYLFIHN